MSLRAPILVCFSLLIASPSFATTLSDSVQMALSTHPDMMIEYVERDIQDSVLVQVESAFLPQVSLALGLGREDSNNTSTRARIGGSEEMERRESSVSLQQMLFDGFDTHWRQAGQEAIVEAAKFELSHAASSLALETIDAHLSFVKAEQVFGFNQESYQVHERISESIRLRVRSGKDDRAKIAQADARLALSMTNLEAARTAKLQSGVTYRKLVGKPPGRRLTSVLDVDMPDEWKLVKKKLIAGNPLLEAKRFHKDAAAKQHKASDSTYMPSLFFESGANWDDNIDGIEGRNSDAYAMFRMRYDLYQGGAKSSFRRQADLARKRADLELDQVLLDVEASAERTWHGYQSLSKRIVFLERYIESALQTREAYQKQFNIGQRSLIDLLDAEGELLQAREKWLEARVQHQLHGFKLSRLMGDLLASLKVSLR